MYTDTLRISRLSQIGRFLSVLRLFLWTIQFIAGWFCFGLAGVIMLAKS